MEKISAHVAAAKARQQQNTLLPRPTAPEPLPGSADAGDMDPVPPSSARRALARPLGQRHSALARVHQRHADRQPVSVVALDSDEELEVLPQGASSTTGNGDAVDHQLLRRPPLAAQSQHMQPPAQRGAGDRESGGLDFGVLHREISKRLAASEAAGFDVDDAADAVPPPWCQSLKQRGSAPAPPSAPPSLGPGSFIMHSSPSSSSSQLPTSPLFTSSSSGSTGSLRPVRPPPTVGTSVIAALRKVRMSEERRQRRVADVEIEGAKHHAKSSPVEFTEAPKAVAAEPIRETASPDAATIYKSRAEDILQQRLEMRRSAQAASKERPIGSTLQHGEPSIREVPLQDNLQELHSSTHCSDGRAPPCEVPSLMPSTTTSRLINPLMSWGELLGTSGEADEQPLSLTNSCSEGLARSLLPPSELEDRTTPPLKPLISWEELLGAGGDEELIMKSEKCDGEIAQHPKEEEEEVVVASEDLAQAAPRDALPPGPKLGWDSSCAASGHHQSSCSSMSTDYTLSRTLQPSTSQGEVSLQTLQPSSSLDEVSYAGESPYPSSRTSTPAELVAVCATWQQTVLASIANGDVESEHELQLVASTTSLLLEPVQEQEQELSQTKSPTVGCGIRPSWQESQQQAQLQETEHDERDDLQFLSPYGPASQQEFQSHLLPAVQHSLAEQLGQPHYPTVLESGCLLDAEKSEATFLQSPALQARAELEEEILLSPSEPIQAPQIPFTVLSDDTSRGLDMHENGQAATAHVERSEGGEEKTVQESKACSLVEDVLLPCIAAPTSSTAEQPPQQDTVAACLMLSSVEAPSPSAGTQPSQQQEAALQVLRKKQADRLAALGHAHAVTESADVQAQRADSTDADDDGGSGAQPDHCNEHAPENSSITCELAPLASMDGACAPCPDDDASVEWDERSQCQVLILEERLPYHIAHCHATRVASLEQQPAGRTSLDEASINAAGEADLSLMISAYREPDSPSPECLGPAMCDVDASGFDVRTGEDGRNCSPRVHARDESASWALSCREFQGDDNEGLNSTMNPMAPGEACSLERPTSSWGRRCCGASGDRGRVEREAASDADEALALPEVGLALPMRLGNVEASLFDLDDSLQAYHLDEDTPSDGSSDGHDFNCMWASRDLYVIMEESSFRSEPASSSSACRSPTIGGPLLQGSDFGRTPSPAGAAVVPGETVPGDHGRSPDSERGMASPGDKGDLCQPSAEDADRSPDVGIAFFDELRHVTDTNAQPEHYSMAVTTAREDVDERFCHEVGTPPLAGLADCAGKEKASHEIALATVSAGAGWDVAEADHSELPSRPSSREECAVSAARALLALRAQRLHEGEEHAATRLQAAWRGHFARSQMPAAVVGHQDCSGVAKRVGRCDASPGCIGASAQQVALTPTPPPSGAAKAGRGRGVRPGSSGGRKLSASGSEPLPSEQQAQGGRGRRALTPRAPPAGSERSNRRHNIADLLEQQANSARARAGAARSGSAGQQLPKLERGHAARAAGRREPTSLPAGQGAGHEAAGAAEVDAFCEARPASARPQDPDVASSASPGNGAAASAGGLVVFTDAAAARVPTAVASLAAASAGSRPASRHAARRPSTAPVAPRSGSAATTPRGGAASTPRASASPGTTPRVAALPRADGRRGPTPRPNYSGTAAAMGLANAVRSPRRLEPRTWG